MKQNIFTDGVQWRKLLEQLRVVTVYGKEDVVMKRCKCCGAVKCGSEFYLKPNSKTELRDFCTSCYSKDTQERSRRLGYKTSEHKKKVLRRKEREMRKRENAGSLEEFMV
jgi:FixJ family two-component response regulator